VSWERSLAGAALAATTVALALASLAAGCSSTDVVVGVLPAHGEGGAPAHRCVNDDDCRAGFCVRDTCDQATGHCEARPVTCDTNKELVCGCDGVTYWNDCLRKQAGVTASALGYCGPGAATCGGGLGACPVAGASCARIFPSVERCPHGDSDAPGVCVLLPPTCPPPGSERLARCGGGPTVCDDECDAIRSERPHLRPGAATCP
jgi:hypothetical protein